MNSYTVLLLAGATAIAGCATRRASSEVVVRDRAFEVTRTISDATTASTFDEHWQGKRQVDEPPDPDWQYKLDIRTGDDVVRWLYDPRGYARVLTVKKSATWRIRDPEAFNAVLGLSNQPVHLTSACGGRR